MMKNIRIVIIVMLLISVVGYMATDREEKDVAHQRDKTFDAKFAK
jgi:hypothetical protein